jgi:hypothetical protein
MEVPEPPPSTLQVTVCGGLPIPTTVALKAQVCPRITVSISGITETPLTGVITVTVAVPNLLVSYVEVARTIRLVVLSFEPTVSTPPGVMEVPEPPPVTLQVTVWAGFPVPCTVAVKVWVCPRITVAEPKFTVTFETVGGATVTVAVPDLVLSYVEVARTVRLVAVSFGSTVSPPPLVILVPEPPPSTLQVTV